MLNNPKNRNARHAVALVVVCDVVPLEIRELMATVIE